MGLFSSSVSRSLLLFTRPIRIFGLLVIYSHNGNENNGDIWSFGITALELARGGLPLSNILPSKSLLLKITKRLGGILPRSRPGEETYCREAAKALFFQELQGRRFFDDECASGFASVEDRFKRKNKMMKGSW
ncbi:hypothetical protein ACFX2C_026682 [Malus domestica]